MDPISIVVLGFTYFLCALGVAFLTFYLTSDSKAWTKYNHAERERVQDDVSIFFFMLLCLVVWPAVLLVVTLVFGGRFLKEEAGKAKNNV